MDPQAALGTSIRRALEQWLALPDAALDSVIGSARPPRGFARNASVTAWKAMWFSRHSKPPLRLAAPACASAPPIEAEVAAVVRCA